MIALLILASLLLSGCINATTRLMPEDTSVPATHEGSDCIVNILNIMIGTATAEQAMAKASSYKDLAMARESRVNNVPAPSPIQPITKIRRSQVTDQFFLIAGARCVEVVGTN